MPLTPVTAEDIQTVSNQLERPARDIVAIAARCVCGNPVVVQTAPRLTDGTPFPTTYYLTCPAATAALSRLEASGLMAELQARLESEPALAEGYRAAHESYLADRTELEQTAGAVAEIAGISAGGMPTRVKCLHALAAHALAAGSGVNPIGDIALELCTWKIDRCQCQPRPEVKNQ